MKKTTLVLGTSLKPTRHSYRTVAALNSEGDPVVAIGPKEGEINGVRVHTEPPSVKNIDTVTIYMKPERQGPFIDYILELQPRRLIFNKKTYNKALWDAAKEKGIQVSEDCTLVLIAKGLYWGD